jgi:hypothetical protein
VAREHLKQQPTGRSAVVRSVLPFLAPRWLATHLLLVVCGAVMIRLGVWQWHVGGVRHGDLRNYAYALQWWAFTAFAVFFWLRLMRDSRRTATGVVSAPDGAAGTAATASGPGAGATGAAQYRRYTMPTAEQIDDDHGDAALAEYNRYLKSLDGPR